MLDRVALLLIVVTAPGTLACQGNSEGDLTQHPANTPAAATSTETTLTEAEFEDVFEWVEPVELQGTEAAVAFRPRVTADPLGGWLVFDPPEGQVRLHDSAGRLKTYFGRKGPGPGEFTNIASVLRTESGDLLTVDRSGRFARWSADGSKMLDEFQAFLYPITSAAWIGRDSLLVLTLPVYERGVTSGPILHIADLSRRTVVRSFYEPAIPLNARTAWATFLGGGIAATDDVMGITLPLLDSLLLVTSATGPVARVPLGIHAKNAEMPDGHSDPETFMEWASQIKVVGSVRAVTDHWLVPLLSVGKSEDGVDLLVVPRGGGNAVVVRRAPILVGTDRTADYIVFDDPTRLEPQYLRTARIRPGKYD